MKNFWLKYRYWLLIVVIFGLAFIGLKPATRVPTEEKESLLSTAKDLDCISVEAELDPEKRRLNVEEHLVLRNTSGSPRDQIVLRTVPNAGASLGSSPYATEELMEACYPKGFSISALSMESALLNGEPVQWSYADSSKTICVISYSWEAGCEVNLDITYWVSIPKACSPLGGIGDSFCLMGAFVYPALWDGEQYRTEALLGWGEPPEGDFANYRVKITLPKGYCCTGSGLVEISSSEGENIYSYTAAGIRSFGLVCSRNFQTVQSNYRDVLLEACCPDAALAEKILSIAQKALKCFESHFGAYPYATLRFAVSDLYTDAITASSLCVLSSSAAENTDTLEENIVLIIARQWWLQAVAPDCFNQSWQTETLCTYSLLLYLQDAYGVAAKEDYETTRLKPSAQMTVTDGVTPGSPLDYFSSLSEFKRVVCGRGSLLPVALDLLGEGRLPEALAVYYQRYCLAHPGRSDFMKTVSEVLGLDIEPLMLDYLDTDY